MLPITSRLMRFVMVAGLAFGAAPALARPGPDGFADLAERLLPGVVNIASTQILKGNADQGPEVPNFPPGSPMEKFFHDFMQRNGRPGAPKEGGAPQESRKSQSLGSGFIIDTAGYVVTNNHVIEGADEIKVILQDNTTLTATVVGRDAKVDVALLKITTTHPLVAVSFGDSDHERVGDWVMAIGNPFGLGGTVTAGIVSARGRDIKQGSYDDFIQTDAPINQGNSGGPLFNMNGDVIGINTAIYSRSGGSIGLGFSIPSNQAKLVIDQLRRFGYAKRGWLGVQIQPVSPDIAESLGLKEPTGALIASTRDGGPAAEATLKGGDVILKFNGADIHELRNLTRDVADTPIGKQVPVLIWRDGQQMTLQVKVGEQPDDQKAVNVATNGVPVTPPQPPKPTELAGLGLVIAGLDNEQRDHFQLPADQKGVVITDVAPNSPASDKGLRPGDVIIEVRQEEVKTPADVTSRVEQDRKANRKSVLMLVQTGNGLRYVPLALVAPKGQGG